MAKSNPMRVFAQAMADHRAGQLAQAEAGYRRVLESIRGHVPSYLNLAMLLAQAGRDGEVDALLDQAIKADPRRTEASMMLAERLGRRNDYAGAVEVLEAAAQRAGEPDAVRVVLAQTLLAWGLASHELARVERARDLAESLGAAPGAQRVLILSLVSLGEHAPARATLEGMLTVPPTREATQAALAWVRLEGGPQQGADDALAPFLDAVDVSHAHLARAHASFARVLRQLRLHTQAIAQAKAGLAHDPACPSAALELARAQRLVGEHEAARTTLEPLIADDAILAAPSARGDDRARKVALFELGSVLDKLGEHEQGLRCVIKAKASLLLEPDATRYPHDQYLAFLQKRERWIASCDVSAWPTDLHDDQPEPIFFVGFPRSGTTLTEQILASHPELGATGEAPVIEKTVGVMRQQLGITAFDAPDWLDNLTDAQVARARELYRTHATQELGVDARKGRIVDKLPLNIVRLPFVRRVFPEARVLVALRDPRDVCISCIFQLFGFNRAMVHLFDVDRTIELYQRVMGLYLAYRDKLGLTILESRYEDLVADTPGQAQRIIAFLGLEWDDRVLDFHERARERVIATPSADQVTQRIYATSVARWKRYEGGAGEAFKKLGPIIQQLGYA